MREPQAPMTDAQIAARRRAARRTALVVGAIAIAIYVAFVASGVVGR
jgi:CHASE3 domain sensor protein